VLELPRMDDHRCWTDAEKDPRASLQDVEALRGFAAMVGDDWSGWRNGAPLACRFLVRLQGGPTEGVRLWRLVEQLRDVPGLVHVVRRELASKVWIEFYAGAMALEFCARARSAGCAVELVQRDSEKSPDSRVKLVDRWVTVEFKALHESEEMEDWNVWEQIIEIGLGARCVSATFDRDLTQQALSDPGAVLDGLVSIAARDVRSYEALPRETGRARIAATNVGRLGYPVEQKPELERLVSKVPSRKWREQLERADGPTLLVVRANTMFGADEPKLVGAAARRIAEALKPKLAGLEMVGAVLVYEDPFSAPAFPIHVKLADLRVRRDTSPSGNARSIVLVHNAGAAAPLTDAELDRLAGDAPVW